MREKLSPEIPEPPYVRVMGRISDRRIAVIDRRRREAVERLALQPGDRVIDAGCGNGASFPFLLSRVGTSGEVAGIEISALMAGRARKHIHENGWENVRLIIAPAQEAALEGAFDALLMFAAHEILTSRETLDHLFAHLKDGARVVAFGAKRSASPLGWLVNPFFHMISKKWLPGTPAIDARPWRLLEERIHPLTVEQRWGGVMYLVSGRK